MNDEQRQAEKEIQEESEQAIREQENYDEEEYKPESNCYCPECRKEGYCAACEDFGCEMMPRTKYHN